MSDWQTFVGKVRKKVEDRAVKHGFVEEYSMGSDKLNELLVTALPRTFALKMPAGIKGNLLVKGVDVSMPSAADVLKLALSCEIVIELAGAKLYQAHLDVFGDAQPKYVAEQERIELVNVHVGRVLLVDDGYAFISNTVDKVAGFVPKTVMGLLDTTVKTTSDVLGMFSGDEVRRYLKLYTSGRKQLVLDYHRDDIERKVVEMVSDGGIAYKLNPENRKQLLFIKYGESVEVADGQLRFRFAKPSGRVKI